ncbi:Zn-dependent exopeptidase [Corynespora cassiicola Philippines]|uniref:Zn-dependent exopeptidase n=1 Tax=Corynespora cassiicola Philippines TaxID=1448308 RepID=A0A2T2NBM0_CORCC|nr:Zn-dependent exopeptidase [Corynespora cassiicola Philippines]
MLLLGLANASSYIPRAATNTTLTPAEIQELYSLHEALVDIPSTSFEEIAAAEFVEEYLTNLGYTVERNQVSNGRFNVFAYPSTLTTWPQVLITSHLDTVPPHIPFSRRVINGTTYHHGRGTVDAKGPIAAQIIATHSFLQSRNSSTTTTTPTPSLGLLFVVGEETGGDGMKAFATYSANTTFRAGIFGEPTEGLLATGHKGSVGGSLSVQGREAHSAYPWLGINAINYITSAIAALNALEPALPAGDVLGNSTLAVGLIAGGIASNIIPPNANASVLVRVASGEPDAIRAQILDALAPVVERLEREGGRFNVSFSQFGYGPQFLDTDVPGLEVGPMFYGTDIPFLPNVEKRYLYGPGSIQVAHKPEEQISQGELVEAAESYGTILRHLFEE